MAQVWSAERQTLAGPLRCAVKVIRPCHAKDPGYRAMFRREARLSLALSGHANVVSVFEVGEHQGRSYLAMELVEGVTLAELSRRVGKPWPVARAVYVVAGILRALCHIHGHAVDGEPQGIVHRDVTPHNVMISASGEVKLMDFGIAQRADAEPCLGGALGKLAYVPREQVEGDLDRRADLYAVGAVLFELLDGRRFRWHCADEDAFFLEIYRDRVPSLVRNDVPSAVSAVLRGLLQPDRERRIASAAKALRQLEAWSGVRGAQSELAAVYAATSGPRSQDGERVQAPVSAKPPSGEPVRVQASASASGRPRRRASDGPRGRRPWEDSPPPTADGDETHWAPTLPHVAARPSATPNEPETAAPLHPRATASTPAWAAGSPGSRATDEPTVPGDLATRLLPAAERNPELAAEPMERLVTRRHPAALTERDVPSARASAEIAVTMPQPSRQAPWAEGTNPIARRVEPEPGTPIKRRRARAGDEQGDRTDSVAPRKRESATVHTAASGGHAAAGGSKPGVVAGEIVTDEGFDAMGEPVWRLRSRRR